MNTDFYTEILEENKEAVKQRVKDAILESVTCRFEWEVPEALNKLVADFMKKEIIPELRKELYESKDEFVDLATEIIRGVPAELGKAMQAKLAETLTDSWKLKKVTSALFD